MYIGHDRWPRQSPAVLSLHSQIQSKYDSAGPAKLLSSISATRQIIVWGRDSGALRGSSEVNGWVISG